MRNLVEFITRKLVSYEYIFKSICTFFFLLAGLIEIVSKSICTFSLSPDDFTAIGYKI